MTGAVLRGFDRSLPMALLRSRESLMRRFRPVLADHDLTEQQWRVIRALAASDLPMDVGEIADATFLLGPSLSRILSNLEQRSLIVRNVDPADQRRSSVELSGAGKDLFARVAPRSEQIYREIEDRFGADRLLELLQLLDDLEKA